MIPATQDHHPSILLHRMQDEFSWIFYQRICLLLIGLLVLLLETSVMAFIFNHRLFSLGIVMIISGSVLVFFTGMSALYEAWQIPEESTTLTREESPVLRNTQRRRNTSNE